MKNASVTCTQNELVPVTPAMIFCECCSLTPFEITEFRGIDLSLLYNAHAILGPTVPPVVIAIASEQPLSTQMIFLRVNRLIADCAAYPDHHLFFQACDIQLIVRFDASYSPALAFPYHWRD